MNYHLGNIEMRDVCAYVRHFADRTISDNQLIVPYPYSEDDAKWWIGHVLADPLRQRTNLVIPNPEGELIGAIGVAGDFAAGSHKAEIGYWFAAECRGQGLMGAVIREFCDGLFSEFSVVRIFATPFSRNTSSHRALEKAGVQKEGLACCYHRKGSEIIDAVIYSRINES